MSQTDSTLLIAGDAAAAEAALAVCAGAGLDARAIPIVVRPLDPIASIAAVAAETVDAQRSAWLLYLRAGERVSKLLAEEIGREMALDTPRAHAFRLRRTLFHRAVPLLLPDPLDDAGEIRLLYRRRARYRGDGSLVSSGTVLRLREPLQLEVRDGGLITMEPGGGVRGLVAVMRRPMTIFHPPTAAFLMRNAASVSAWSHASTGANESERHSP